MDLAIRFDAAAALKASARANEGSQLQCRPVVCLPPVWVEGGRWRVEGWGSCA